jgi:hypothetical protein
LGDGEHCTVEVWEWFILSEKDVSSCLAAWLGFIEKTGVGVSTKDHVTSSIDNAVIRVGSNIVQDLSTLKSWSMTINCFSTLDFR